MYCPVGAITERNQAREVLTNIKTSAKKCYVCQVSPGVHVALADALGISPSVLTHGKIATLLRQVGFQKVYDTSFGTDVLVMEEAAQLVNRLQNNANGPFISSACPAFINYIEQSASQFIPNLSTARTAPSILSAILREVLPGQLNLHSEDIYNVTVSTCLAKKDEIERPVLFNAQGGKDTDVCLSVRELVDLIKMAKINVHELPEGEFDHLFNGEASSAGTLAETAGGFMEATLRTAEYLITGKAPKKLEIKNLRGDKAQKVAEVKLGDKTIKVAAIQGMANAMKFLDKVKKDKSLKDVKYVEIMACQGGCVIGGGTPMPKAKESLTERVKAIISEDASAQIRCAHDSPAVKEVYSRLLEKPNSHKAHELLHTHFSHRPGF